MDYRYLQRCHDLSCSISKRISSLPESFNRVFVQKFALRYSKIPTLLKGAAFFLVALVLGLWANQSSEFYALLGWRQNEGPSSQIWQYTLEAKHYFKIINTEAKEKTLRSLPLSVDTRNSVWISLDGHRIVVFLKENQNNEPLAFSDGFIEPKKPGFHKTLPTPVQWELVGRGWVGFDELLIRIDKKPPLILARPKLQYHDSREILF